MNTVEEVAQTLRLAPFTVRKWARDSKIPAVKIGRAWMFDINHVELALKATGNNRLARSMGRAMRRAA